MAGYFNEFPKVLYTFDEAVVNPQLVTNILARSTFLKEIVDNTAIYYEYQLKEGDTPEIIADKLYGDPQRHWIVLLFNRILNPFYEFPLTPTELESYMIAKYGHSSNVCRTTLHHYEQTTTRTTLYNGAVTDSESDTVYVSEYSVNFDTGALTPRTLPALGASITTSSETVFFSPYQINTVITVTAVSEYDYEMAQNEQRRTIKLLDNAYISRIEDEFIRLMKNG